MDKFLCGRRILVVEDEMLILMMIEAMLADTPSDPELRYMLAMECVSAGDDTGAVRGRTPLPGFVRHLRRQLRERPSRPARRL